MPFRSEKQRRYMFANHPKIAHRWAHEGSTSGKGGGFTDLLKNIVGIFKPVQGAQQAQKAQTPNTPFPTPTDTDQQWRKKRMDFINSGGTIKSDLTPEEIRAMEIRPPPMNPYEKLTRPTFEQQQLPLDVMYGIFDGEGKTFNLGNTDSNPKGGYNYGSALKEASAAAKTLNGTFQYGDILPDGTIKYNGQYNRTFQPAFDQYKIDQNSENFLHNITQLGYAGDPKTWKQRSIDEAHAAGTTGAGEYFDTYEDYIKSLTGWKRWHGKKTK